MSDSIPGILALFVLLAGNAFFVGAEFAVISARRSQIEPKAAAGDSRAKTALWAMEHATLMLSTCQLGITLCSIIILQVSEPAIHHLLQVPLEAIGLSTSIITPTAFVVTLLLVTYLHVVFGEMVPKNMAFSVPDQAVLWLAPPLVAISRVLKPVIVAMDWVANHALRLVGVEPKKEANSTFTLDQIETIVDESTSTGSLEDRSGTLSATFEFSTQKVEDVMIPADQFTLLSGSATPRDIQSSVAATGFSRYFLSNGDAHTPLGYVHVKDLLDLTSADALDSPVPVEVVRPLSPSPVAQDVEDALASMRSSNSHVNIVVDPSDQFVGLLFLEDILELLIGEVSDATQVATDS